MVVPWLVHYKVVRRKGHDLQNIRYVNRVEALRRHMTAAGHPRFRPRKT